MEKLKENETVELKKSTSEIKEAVIAISAILNKHGRGELYFGVKNDGAAVGQDISEKTIRDVSRAVSEGIEPKIFPVIKIKKIKDKNCLIVEFEGCEKPYLAYGRAYMRVGDENRQLNRAGLEKMIIKKNESGWETVVTGRNITEISVKLLRGFVAKANKAGRINYRFTNSAGVLNKLGVISGKKLLRAGEVLFCSENKVVVQAAVFAGTDKVTFLDIRDFGGSLFSLAKQAEAYIKEHINWRADLSKSSREEIPEIPLRAISEAVINSLCHRDFSNPKGNEIAVFKDRVEIYNPGQFPEDYTPMDFIKGGERSILRNPIIANVFYLREDIERWGSGLRRIYEECKKAGVKVEFKKLKSGFLSVFYRGGFVPDAKAGTAQKTIQKTTQKIMELIKQNPELTRRELAEKIGISDSGIKFSLNQLKKKGGKEIIDDRLVERLVEGLVERLVESQKKIFAIMSGNPDISKRELAEKLGISVTAIDKNISTLKKKGLIKRVGPDKGGYWEVAGKK